jgi:Asp/Glu/hydantoin racemase
MTREPSRIALIHALEESVKPARAAFSECWPEAYAFDLLDTSLAEDFAHSGKLDAGMMGRFQALAEYAAGSTGIGGRAAGILFTCSAFGPAIDAVKARFPIPVLRPNESAFDAALQLGNRLGLVVSFGPSKQSLEAELRSMAAEKDQAVEVRTVLAEGALAALKVGHSQEHDRIVAEAAVGLGAVDAIVLGQFSLARARDVVTPACGRPVITTPHSAVLALRHRIEQGQPA